MRKYFRPLVFMQLGVLMVSAILLSLAAGLWIDGQFGTSPWATLAGMLVGTLAGFLGVYRLISRVFEEIGRDKQK